jgi:hypothetical protein
MPQMSGAGARAAATEATIIIAVGHPCGTILRACLCHQAANLARGCGERTRMVVRLMTRHGDDQEFEIVDHTVLLERRGQRCAHSSRGRHASL